MDRSTGTHFDYVTVGHVTRDAIEDSSSPGTRHQPGGSRYQPGGSAFYSALQAARLGLRTLILTQGVREEVESLLAPYRDELELHVIPADHTTTLSTRGLGEHRTQRVLAWAGPIVDAIELDTDILHLAPIARETPNSWRGRASFVGITPQGLVRHWEQAAGMVPLVQLFTGSMLGEVALAPPPGCEALAGEVSSIVLDPTLLPASFDAAVISEHELPSCHSLFSAARRCKASLAVTAGSRPTTVHTATAGVLQTSLPPHVTMHEDIGAGDVFAAGFFVALAEGRTPLEAAAFGNAAASVRIAGAGAGAIGGRTQIEELLHKSTQEG
jgi:sugar/nucleoside kinase (ribokinase family)